MSRLTYSSGEVVAFQTKAHVVLHWPGVVGSIGNGYASPFFADALNREFSSFDGLVADAEKALPEIVEEFFDGFALSGGADVILAGIGEDGPAAYTFRIDDSLPMTATEEDAAASQYWSDRPMSEVSKYVINQKRGVVCCRSPLALLARQRRSSRAICLIWSAAHQRVAART